MMWQPEKGNELNFWPVDTDNVIMVKILAEADKCQRARNLRGIHTCCFNATVIQ